MGTEIPYAEFSYDVSGGCTKYREGCKNCWAIQSVHRLAHNPLQGDKWKGLVTADGKNWTGIIQVFEEMLTKKGGPSYSPLNRKKPARYFVNSKADLFHPDMQFSYIDKVFAAIHSAPQHTYLIFTKRIEEALKYVKYIEKICGDNPFLHKNIQLIVSISTQKDADEMIPILLQIPAAYRGISAEPLLGAVDIASWGWRNTASYQPRVRWVVVGCESGPKRRPCKLEHIRSIVQRGKDAGIPVFVKQIEINGKVEHDIKKFPEWARVRETI